jgi:hypothetical protein
LKKKRGLQIITGSHSPQKQQQQTGLYLGNKTGKSYSTHGGMSYTKRNTGGCGCGSKVAKKTGLQAKK